jgi:hypothetical protein
MTHFLQQFTLINGRFSLVQNEARAVVVLTGDGQSSSPFRVRHPQKQPQVVGTLLPMPWVGDTPARVDVR